MEVRKAAKRGPQSGSAVRNRNLVELDTEEIRITKQGDVCESNIA